MDRDRLSQSHTWKLLRSLSRKKPELLSVEYIKHQGSYFITIVLPNQPYYSRYLTVSKRLNKIQFTDNYISSDKILLLAAELGYLTWIEPYITSVETRQEPNHKWGSSYPTYEPESDTLEMDATEQSSLLNSWQEEYGDALDGLDDAAARSLVRREEHAESEGYENIPEYDNLFYFGNAIHKHFMEGGQKCTWEQIETFATQVLSSCTEETIPDNFPLPFGSLKKIIDSVSKEQSVGSILNHLSGYLYARSIYEKGYDPKDLDNKYRVRHRIFRARLIPNHQTEIPLGELNYKHASDNINLETSEHFLRCVLNEIILSHLGIPVSKEEHVMIPDYHYGQYTGDIEHTYEVFPDKDNSHDMPEDLYRKEFHVLPDLDKESYESSSVIDIYENIPINQTVLVIREAMNSLEFKCDMFSHGAGTSDPIDIRTNVCCTLSTLDGISEFIPKNASLVRIENAVIGEHAETLHITGDISVIT